MHVFSDDAAQGSFNDNEMNSSVAALPLLLKLDADDWGW